MLTFFRKFRKSLLHSNQIRKYIPYALGEIALVVIGILIALQINNWNEWRQDRIYERKMFGEIKASLQLDILELENLLGLCQFLKEDSEKGYKILESANPDLDTLAAILGVAIQLDVTFQYSAFESLKSKGLDNLSNDSLRVKLSAHYDQSYQKLEQKLNNYNETLRIQWRPMVSDYTRVEFLDGYLYNYPLNTIEIDNNHKLSSMLKVKTYIIGRYSVYIQELLEECKELSGAIKTELEK